VDKQFKKFFGETLDAYRYTERGAQIEYERILSAIEKKYK